MDEVYTIKKPDISAKYLSIMIPFVIALALSGYFLGKYLAEKERECSEYSKPSCLSVDDDPVCESGKWVCNFA